MSNYFDKNYEAMGSEFTEGRELKVNRNEVEVYGEQEAYRLAYCRQQGLPAIPKEDLYD